MGKEINLGKVKQSKIVEGIHNELGENVDVSVYVKRAVPKQSTYVMFYQEVNLELVKLLKPNACKVLLYLMSKTQYDNYVGVNQETIQEDLDYKSKDSIIQAIKELKKYNIILSLPDLQDRRRNVYYINPYQSWKGKVAKRIEQVKKAHDRIGIQLELPFTSRTL